MANSSGNQDSVSLSRMTPVSWSVSEQIYEQIDSDIKINRLLATYHPDDGVLAYERILKAFGTSSEAVTSDTWQELVQTLPLPNGASEDDVKDVICRVTGFSRDSLIFCTGTEIPREELLNKKTSQYQNSIDNNNGIHNSDVKYAQAEDNKSKCVSSVSEEFLGFPPQEISVTTNRIHDGQNFREMLNCSSSCTRSRKDPADLGMKFKWLHPQRVLHKSNPYSAPGKYRQAVLNTMGGKFIQLPIGKLSNYNRGPGNSRGSSKIHNQAETIRSKPEHSRNSEVRKPEISELDFKWDYYTPNYSSNDRQMIAGGKRFEDNTKLRQQEDIRKMDFVHWQEESSNPSNDTRSENCETSLEDNLMVSDRLKTCIQNFLNRAQKNIVVEVQTPATRSMTLPPRTSPQESETRNQTLERNKEFVTAEIPKKQKPIPISDGAKEFVRKKSLGGCNDFNHLQNPLPVPNLAHRMKRTGQNNRIMLQQPTPVSEFATYRKQYCDTMFNIQKAKVVTASSMETGRPEPCYSSCPYQRQLLHQEDQLMTNASYGVPQSGLLNIHRVPCAWLSCSNWKYPIMGDLKYQQQQSSLPCPRDKEIKWMTNYKQNPASKSKQLRQSVQRKKLEDIVGMLKDADNTANN